MALSEGIPSRSVEFDGTRMFDSAYGEFPKQINMPHTLTMDGFADSKSSLTGLENPVPTDDFSNMHVPERIVVIGGEKMASTREPFPEMRLESLFMGDFAKKNQIDLPTPPSTLTLEEMSPKKDPEYYANARKKVTTDLFDAKNDNESEVARSSSFDMGLDNTSIFNSLNASMDEFSALKKQIRYLQRRMARAEDEIHRRNQREFLIYTIGIVYFAMKGLFFLRKIW